MFGNKLSPIGIDFGTSWIKAVQLQQTRVGARLSAALAVPRESGPLSADSIGRLSAVMRRQGFVGSRVVFACPAEQLMSEVLELPGGNDAPIEQIAFAEMRRLRRLETESFEMAYWPLPASARASSGTCVMAVAATESATEATAQLLDDAGFETLAVDAHACALARACQPLNQDGLAVIVDLGNTAAVIALASGGVVLYQRVVTDAGLSILRNSVSDELHFDEAEADCVLRQVGAQTSSGDEPPSPKEYRLRVLVTSYMEQIEREIETSVAFALHRYPSLRATGVLLAGGGARMPNLARLLAERLNLPVAPIRMSAIGIGHPSMAEFDACPELTAAVGMALNQS